MKRTHTKQTDLFLVRKCDEHSKDENVAHEDKNKSVTIQGKGEKQCFNRDRRGTLTRFEGRWRGKMEVLEESKMTPRYLVWKIGFCYIPHILYFDDCILWCYFSCPPSPCISCRLSVSYGA